MTVQFSLAMTVINHLLSLYRSSGLTIFADA